LRYQQRAQNFEELAMAEPAPPSLMGKVIDYILGRNTLIGLASFMLLLISGYATWHGMRDFIIGVSSTPTSQGQLLPGGLSLSNDFLVIAVVVALTFLMWLMLRESFGARRQLRERLITFPLYLSPRRLVDRLWLRLLVEPDLRARRPRAPDLQALREDARDAAQVGPRAARCRAWPARQRGRLVGQPDAAGRDEWRQLRGAVGGRPRPALATRGATFATKLRPCATA
jgi:hypothetical protein